MYNHRESPTSSQGKGVKRPLGPTGKEESGKSKCKSPNLGINTNRLNGAQRQSHSASQGAFCLL